MVRAVLKESYDGAMACRTEQAWQEVAIVPQMCACVCVCVGSRKDFSSPQHIIIAHPTLSDATNSRMFNEPGHFLSQAVPLGILLK